jgi:hypothetical protein
MVGAGSIAEERSLAACPRVGVSGSGSMWTYGRMAMKWHDKTALGCSVVPFHG